MRSGVLALLVALGTGCGGRELQSRRLAWQEERAALGEGLDDLGARLLATQARVRLWRELRERHEGVAAIACENLGEHDRAERDSRHRGRQRFAQGRRGRVAARFTGTDAWP